MTELDPYQPPATELQTPIQVGTGGQVLATRGERYGAALIDGLLVGVIVMPLGFMAGVFGDPNANSMFTTIAMGLGGLLVTLVVQGYFLATRAQSLGKMALKIKIVTLDGNNADFKRIVLLRTLPTSLAAAIPFIGSALNLVDVLFIFRDDQRCLHDHIAGTRVVKV